MHNTRIFKMAFASVSPHYIAKAEKKGRTKTEVDTIICWLTGYIKTIRRNYFLKIYFILNYATPPFVEVTRWVIEFVPRFLLFGGTRNLIKGNNKILDWDCMVSPLWK